MTRITDKTVASMNNQVKDQGAILINVLLIAMLMSIFIAASLVLLNAPVNAYNNDLNTTQAYYNAKAGLIVGEDQIASTTNASNNNLGMITKSYPYYSPTTTLGSGTFQISITVTPSTPTPSTKTLTFTITSTGVAGNQQSPPVRTQTLTTTVNY